MNERVRDSPLDAPPDAGEYMRDLRDMWRSVLLAAQACGATTVVAPDAGCGVFRNPADQVGRAFGEVLSEHTYGVREVLISGRRDFFEAVQAAAPAGAASQEPVLVKTESAVRIQAAARGKATRRTYPDVPEADGRPQGPAAEEPIPCKFGCGAMAAPGRTRSGRRMDTCCRDCAKSKGGGKHSRGCPGLAAMGTPPTCPPC